MFAIAAINDTDTSGQWEPLAPTKEAQEFHLSQTYHEGLLKLQAKDYAKARELLEAVLRDPLISSSQVHNNASDGHLLQLRFLSLKNLATVFLQQGSVHYESALHCYLQAVEIDAADSVIWNQLGTLSCNMGLLSTSRWAFEQGLLCSPNNWNCMEKLLEVLVAIGDEVACISVADLILRHWPLHSRALHVKNTIEDAEPTPFAPRGVDKLEPKHIRLKFPQKRKATDYVIDENATSKSRNQSIELQLAGATWASLADAILGILLHAIRKVSDLGVVHDHDKMERHTDVKIDICLSTSSDIIMDPVGENSSLAYGFEKTSTVKEKEICMDKEHPQERRSTRLERLRSRKSGKEESECAGGKDLGKVVFQFLEPFVLNKPKSRDDGSSDNSSGPYSDTLTYSSVLEYNDVIRFISGASRNFGAYHVGHLLLEEVAQIDIPFQDSFVKFLELEKMTRSWGRDRTPLCSLFLAELYYDQGSWFANESNRSELFSEASFHLCKVIESVALNSPHDLIDTGLRDTMEMNDPDRIRKIMDFTAENGNIDLTDTSGSEESKDHNTAFWVRFFWLSGHLSLFSGCKTKAFNEFCICLSLLRNSKEFEETSHTVSLPHCKFVRSLTVDIIFRKINLLKLDAILGKTTDELIEKGKYSECINMLAPLLLSKENGGVSSVEPSALDVLMLACEKEEPMNIDVFFRCHWQKLQLLTTAASAEDSHFPQKGKSSLLVTGVASDLENMEATNTHWIHMVAQEVKDISRSVSRVKNLVDQCDTNDGFSSLACIISDIQSLLLTAMSSVVRTIISQKISGLGSGQLESCCLVDATIAFCKLQHLDPSVPVKTQVDLIVAVHDLLAEYGLCCAGQDSEGEEGPFLKLAIKHLLALDVKLKSLNGINGKDKDAPEATTHEYLSAHEEHEKDDEGLENGNNTTNVINDTVSLPVDLEMEKVELGIENALDQCFFCLYGLNINPDSSSEDDLAIHKNTSRGDYQTKEQCADVFQYILPYAKALSRAGLVKLRRVLRAIRKHFPQPPTEVLSENAIDKFLDGSDSCEDKLCDISGSDGSREFIMNILFNNGRGPEALKPSVAGSELYLEVYGNLYCLIAQAEEISASDKYAGFVLKKEGEEFVEQNANLFKYDLLYNPLRFESWQKLANIYDEEVDLLLNDGSKHINVVDWRKNTTLPRRVEIGRRRSRRCLLMSLALARNPVQQSQIHELLALVYYDSLQNVVPFYDQRSFIPTKDAAWMKFCRNSMKYFEKAFALRPDWLHGFYLGKLCEKMGYSSLKAFSYYSRAAALNPSAVDPVYRIHASRLKLLYTQGKQNLYILQIVAAYAFNQSTKGKILDMFSWSSQDLMQVTLDVKDVSVLDDSNDKKNIEPSILDAAWHVLYEDCLSALEICVEGELKHFHKARYMLARGLYKRGEDGDLERAKDELSFCFKSSRSLFTINMWEIDGTAKRGRRKNPGLGGNKRNLEVTLSESSRKFITCIRKYILFYLNLLEKTRDLSTLERAYMYLRTDKRFSLSLGDIVPVALGKYIQILTSSIRNAEACGATDGTSLEQMLERMFSLFMDNMNIWTDIGSLPEVNSPDLSETNLYGFIHQYVRLLESGLRLDALEAMNEKIRRRFKNPKLSSSSFAKVCKHASLAWCRVILIKLVSITLPPDPGNPSDQTGGLDSGLLLFVDLQPDEFLSTSLEGPSHSKPDVSQYQVLYRVKNLRVRQTSEETMEAAVALMRCAYNFYRESSCGTLPSGINMYTLFSLEGGPGPLDLSIPRKLLLWAHTLVHGRYSNISAVVKYCEDNAKARLRRGNMALLALPQSNTQVVVREGNDRDEHGEGVDNPSIAAVSASMHQEDTACPAPYEASKTFDAAAQLQRCNAIKIEADQEGCQGNTTN